jgi:tRNA threonylcarbamoyladenosine biosynthesis protein TsaE
MSELVYESDSEESTARLGRMLAEHLPDGAVVALCGTLGAGKTRLVQAMAEACGVNRRDVVSPTFVLMQPYHARRTLFHFDAYRVADEDEFLALGPDEYFESDGLTLIEWADRVEGCLPRERIEVVAEVTGDTTRRFTLRAIGPRYRAAVEEIGRRIAREPCP